MNQIVNVRLTALEGIGITTLNNGKENMECLVIPMKQNYLSQTERGDIYLNLIAWGSDKLKDGKTHLIKQSLPKEVREKMSKEEMSNLPILGDMKPMEDAPAKPMVAYTTTAAANPAPSPEEDLPEWMRG